MKYKCPSCKINWEDTLEPVMQISTPLCVFCSGRHTQRELINWQMDHINDISLKDYGNVISHMYKALDGEINLLKENKE